MCQIYLGWREDINWCKAFDESLCDHLMRILFSYGNFGSKHGEGKKVENVTTRIREKSLFRYLQTAGENTWKLYQRHRWVRPFCWSYQIGRLVVKGIESGRGKKVLLDIENSNERFDLLRKLGVYPE